MAPDDIAAHMLEIAIHALYAIGQWRTHGENAEGAAEALTHALHDHGDLVLVVVDAPENDDTLRITG